MERDGSAGRVLGSEVRFLLGPHLTDIGEGLWPIVPPVDAEHRVGRVLRGQGVVNEAVFSGDHGELKDAFQAITQGLTDCLDGPAHPNPAESGWDLVVAEKPALGVGDADSLIRQRLYYEQPDPTVPFCDHRLAIVLYGARLVIVEHTGIGATAVESNPLAVRMTTSP